MNRNRKHSGSYGRSRFQRRNFYQCFFHLEWSTEIRSFSIQTWTVAGTKLENMRKSELVNPVKIKLSRTVHNHRTIEILKQG